MRAEVELTAGPDDPGPTHYDRDAADGCQCQTCRRRAAMLEPGRVPRVDAVTGRSWPNPPHGAHETDLPLLPPRHPTNGRFVSHIDSIEDEPGELDLPPQHPETGRFLAAQHDDHDDRDVHGRFIDELTRQVHEQR